MTTTCESCRERLIDHHYGELPLRHARETAEHLSECASCALEYCRLSAALAGFRALDHEAPRPEVQRELRAKVADAFRPALPRRIARLLAVRVPLYQPALIALFVFFVWTVVRSFAPAVPEPTTPTVMERFDGTRVDFFDHVL